MGAVSELALCLSSGYPVNSVGGVMSKIPFSQCREIIRNAREHCGYKYYSPWSAWLGGSDWMSCPDFETGSCDFRGWAGLWKLDHNDLSSPHLLFRELRDTRITCVVLIETPDGFVRAWPENRPVELVESDLESEFSESSYCSICGGQCGDMLDFNDNPVCWNCAEQCAICEDVELKSDLSGAVVVVDHDTGTMDYICRGCLSD